MSLTTAIRLTLLCFLLAGDLPSVGWAAQTRREPPRSAFSSTYRTALRLLQQNKPAEALAEIDSGLKRSPNDASLHNLRGLALGSLGRLDDAEASFRNVIRLQPDAALGHSNLAVLYEETGRNKEAVPLFREALKREPTNPIFMMRLGANLAALEQYNEASPHLAKAWAARPGDFRTGYEYARTLRELKKPLEAAKVLRRLTPPSDPALAARFHALSALVAEERGDKAAALQSYRRAYELNPQSAELYVKIAQVALEAGGLKATENLPPPPARLSAEVHFALGTLFASHDASRLAVAHFEEALRQAPEDYATTFNLALAYRAAGQTEKGIEFLRRKIEREPTAELVNLLASLEEEAGNFVEAARNYQRAVELDPGSEQYVFDLGAEYVAHFNMGLAMEVFRVGTERFPKSPRQFLGLGVAHFGLRQYTEAANAFLAALEFDPSSPGAFSLWNGLGPMLSSAEWERFIPRLKLLAESHPATAEAQFCYGATLLRVGLASGKAEWLAGSERVLASTVSLKPGFVEAHLELGNLFAARKQEERALKEFLEVIRLDPNSDTAHYRLGQTYRNLGRLELAQQALSRYAELAQSRRERTMRSRQESKQFIVIQPGPKSAPADSPGKQ